MVSGAVGAGGAIAGQIVAGVAAARREAKAAAERRADSRASAFSDAKVKIFAEVLGMIDAHLDRTEAIRRQRERGEDVEPPLVDTGVWAKVAAEVDLLAPEVTKAVDDCLFHLWMIRSNLLVGGGDLVHEQQGRRLRDARTRLHATMRVSLNIADGPRRGGAAT